MNDGWVSTGDIFSVDDDGFYYYVGRADDMFVCSGENIYPSELETLIERLNTVVQTGVVAIDDLRRGQIPVAFVVADKNSDISEQLVKDFVLANAPAYMHPRHVFFVDELPLAATNKVDKKKLQAIALQALC
jgi:acyl-CoA synthetase (AMP-forming)/AMP-acid ligase II